MSVRLTKRPFLGRGLMRAAVALAYLIVFAPVFTIVVTSFFFATDRQFSARGPDVALVRQRLADP